MFVRRTPATSVAAVVKHRATIGYVLLAIGVVLGLGKSYSNDNHLRATSARQHQTDLLLASEIVHRCRTSERVIHVLNKEHTVKLALLKNELHRQVAYLQAVKSGKRSRIPNIKDSEIQEGITLRQKEIKNEKRIIRETAPTPCSLGGS